MPAPGNTEIEIEPSDIISLNPDVLLLIVPSNGQDLTLAWQSAVIGFFPLSDLPAIANGHTFVVDGDALLAASSSGPEQRADAVRMVSQILATQSGGTPSSELPDCGRRFLQFNALSFRIYAGQRLAPPPSSTPPPTPDAAGCRAVLIAAVRRIAARHPGGVHVLLSGGVDTAAALEANLAAGSPLRIRGGLTVLAGGGGSDRPYAAAVAARHGAPHRVLDVPLDAVVERIPDCVRALRTFDGMELRNSAAVAVALVEAKRDGATAVLTGVRPPARPPAAAPAAGVSRPHCACPHPHPLPCPSITPCLPLASRARVPERYPRRVREISRAISRRPRVRAPVRAVRSRDRASVSAPCVSEFVCV